MPNINMPNPKTKRNKPFKSSLALVFFIFGTKNKVKTKLSKQSGRGIKKFIFQEKNSVDIPAKKGPKHKNTELIPALIPKALPNWCGGNSRIKIPIAEGSIKAAPMPCSPLIIKYPMLKSQKTEDIAGSTYIIVPSVNIFLGPYTSDNLPAKITNILVQI